jgi:hypothetical protein
LKNSRAVIYQTFWLLILGCFVGVGLNGYRTRGDTPKIDGTGPNCSTDALLKGSLHVSGASEKITAEFDERQRQRNHQLPDRQLPRVAARGVVGADGHAPHRQGRGGF